MTQAEHPTSLAALRARYGVRYRWLLLLAVMVGTMASIMSSTIVNVAIPGMSQHFALGQERAQWVTSGFMVAMTVSMLTTPWLLARYGYRHTYVACMVLLLAGGVVGGFATRFDLVLAARVAEGLAAGVVQPIPAIIILRAFEPNEQGRASGIFGMGVVLAPALGPSIGGLLVDWFGWRSIFFMVVPFCLASLWLAYKFVPVTAPVALRPTATALPWTGSDWRWPVPARCACSTAWWNCTAARPRRPAPFWPVRWWRWWPSSPCSATCCGSARAAGVSR
jgi:MFS family permease